jgi:hypothetical protein
VNLPPGDIIITISVLNSSPPMPYVNCTFLTCYKSYNIDSNYFVCQLYL